MRQIASKSGAAIGEENPYHASQVTPPEPQEDSDVLDWLLAVAMIVGFWSLLAVISFPFLCRVAAFLASLVDQ